MTRTFRYGCPYCGSEEIEEVSEVVAWHPVTAWTEEGNPADFGAPTPQSWRALPAATSFVNGILHLPGLLGRR